MLEHYLESVTIWASLFQAILLTAPIPISFIAYSILSMSQQRVLCKAALLDLGMTDADIKAALGEGDSDANKLKKYDRRDFFVPVTLATLLTFVTFSITHPYTIQTVGTWTGFLEETVNIFGLPPEEIAIRDIVLGRVLFYAYFGAYLYTISLIVRRWMSLDLTPNVYIHASLRFVTALFVANMVAMSLGLINQNLNMNFDNNMMTVSLVAFVIGFFPEVGLIWLTNRAYDILKIKGNISNETPLNRVEGISIWVQGRLRQEDVENVHTLATVDIPGLVINSPFTVAQIIDWVDQAILITHANDLYPYLEDVGVRSASDLVTIARKNNTNPGQFSQLAAVVADLQAVGEIKKQQSNGNNAVAPVLKTDLQTVETRLTMLATSVRAARNAQITTFYRWRYNIDPDLRLSVAELKIEPFPPSVVEADTVPDYLAVGGIAARTS